MDMCSEIFPIDGPNSSAYFFNNITVELNKFDISSVVGVIAVLLGFPINPYVIWLIVTGAGNGLAAEFFSLNLAVCEILVFMEPLASLFRYKDESVLIVDGFLQGLAIAGRPLFQSLICVERYLAVVHPVTFLKLKPLRYRAICCALVWVTALSISGISIVIVFLKLHKMLYFTFFLIQFVFFLSVKIFCYVAVLTALKLSGPGERAKELENHMKRKAFHLIQISTVTLVIIYVPVAILLFSVISSLQPPDILICISYVFFTSAGLVQPLLFLNRVEKLPFINYQ